MVRAIKDVLKAMGWVDGYSMPISNEDNQRLEAEIEQLFQKKAEIVVKNEIARDRLAALQRNEKKLVEEKLANQSLLQALRKNYDTEITAVRNYETEYNSMKYDMKQMEGEMKVTGNRVGFTKAEINKFRKELEQLSALLEWEEEALFTWDDELAKGDHHNQMLKNIELHDFDKFNELELRRQMLQGDLTNQQQTEQNDMDLLIRTQAMLQAQVAIFNETRKNKSKLMSRWYDSSKMLDGRKSQIQDIETAATNLKIETEEMIESTEPVQRRAEMMRRENAQMRSGVESFKMRLKQGDDLRVEKEKSMDELRDELFNMENEIEDQSSKNKSTKAKIKEIHDTIKSRREKAERINTACLKLKSKLDTLNITVLTDEQKRKNADEIHQLGMKVLREEERELERLHNATCALGSELSRLKNEELIVRNEMNLAKRDRAQIENELTDLKLEVEQIHKDIQAGEEDVVHLSQKLRDIVDDDLSSDLERKFTQESTNISMSIQTQKREHTTLRLEIKHLRKELRDINRTLNKGTQELTEHTSKAIDLKLKMIGGNKHLKEAQEEQNQVILDLNLLKMQASVAKEAFKNTEYQINNLERKKVALESALLERMMDCKSHKETLVTRKKLLQEERTSLKKSVDHLNQRIKQLNIREALIMDTIGQGDTANTNMMAHFQIKLAQEKREFIENGDDLQAKIEKAETEITAMEHTLRLVNGANENFRSNLETIELNAPEMQEFDKVEGEYHQEHEQYLSNMKMVQDITKAITKTKASIAQLQETGNEVEQQWKSKEREIELLSKSLATKQSKLCCATKILKKMQSDIISKKGTTGSKHTLKDIDTRIITVQNDSAINQLAELTHNYLETRPVVNMLLSENGVAWTEPSKKTAGHSSQAAGRSLRSGQEPSPQPDRDVDQFREAETCLSPFVINLDPTLLIPDERRKAFKDYSSKCGK